MQRGDPERDLELVLMGMVLASVGSGKKVLARIEACELTKEHRELYESLRNSLQTGAPATENGVLKKWLAARGARLDGAAGEAVMEQVAQNGATRRMKDAARRIALHAASGMPAEECFRLMTELGENKGKRKSS